MKDCTKVERITCVVDEDKTHNGKPLFKAIVEEAQNMGLAGATVVKGVMGFGAAKRLHRERPLGRTSDVPMVVMIVDEKDKLDAFIPKLCSMVSEGLILREPPEIWLVNCEEKIEE